MGVGLVIAVLGLGSTFAANITINNDQDSEFGQGVTQTVYCGENEVDIKVSPVSAFTNESSYVVPGVAAVPSRWTAPTFAGRSFVKVSSSSSTAVGEATYVNDSSGASENKVKGYWISSRTSSNPTYSSNGNSSGSNTLFVPQVRDNGDYGFYKYASWTPGSQSVGVQAVAPRTVEVDSDFKLKGITVSGIADECDGIDFILSVFDNSSTPLPLAYGEVGTYNEIAVLFDDVQEETTAVWSFNRQGPPNSGDLALVKNSPSRITITFKEPRVDTDVLKSIVVETQNNLLFTNQPGGGNDDDDDDRDN
jgi:hypothetical protein